MLKCELRDRWVEALESGRYEQGKECLEENGKFCCLGVLCEVAGIPKRKKGKNTAYNVPSAGGDWTTIDYPIEIAGLSDFDCRNLAQLNDNGVSFTEIAQIIRNEVECEQ